MEKNDTHVSLQHWIPQYIRERGRTKFAELVGIPEGLKRLAADQDKIGWNNFMGERVATQIITIQSCRLNNEDYGTEKTWMRGFIRKLLDISHNQWLVRNLHKHHHTKGIKARDSKKNLLDKIEKQLDLGSENIPPDDRWMLEMNHTSLLSNNDQELQYWLLEVEAA